MAWPKAENPKNTRLAVRIDKEEEVLLAVALEKTGLTLSDFLRQAVSDRIAIAVAETTQENFLFMKVNELDKENLRMKRKVQLYTGKLLEAFGFTGGKIVEG